MSWKNQAEKFLKEAEKYQLGTLPTESSHPETRNLSEWSQHDLPKALSELKRLDLYVLEVLLKNTDKIHQLFDEVQQAFLGGDRVFICGCGATGRLALTIEALWRRLHPGSEQVFSFMAGGDIALVHSLEGFEDYPEYGARHLEQVGFRQGDLLIAVTEGGETPYVIGAALRAAELTQRPTFFLYCNPREMLLQRVERSAKVFNNPKIVDQEYFVGPMALSGSTRMQASTALELVVGLALLSKNKDQMDQSLKSFYEEYSRFAVEPLKGFIEKESRIYLESGYLLYSAADYAMTVFTDTTERSPTFSLTPFEPLKGEQLKFGRPSLSYVMLDRTDTPIEAWESLLCRKPRCLDWKEIDIETTEEYLLSFDFSCKVKGVRQSYLQLQEQILFSIKNKNERIDWSLEEENWSIPKPQQGLLYEHILLKMLLNMHSTLVMGRLQRYIGNQMTWVRPSNGKLIDRAARYLISIQEQRSGSLISYSRAVELIFEAKALVQKDQSVVLWALDKLSKEI